MAFLATQHLWETIVTPELLAFLTTNTAALLGILGTQLSRRTVPAETLAVVQEIKIKLDDHIEHHTEMEVR